MTSLPTALIGIDALMNEIRAEAERRKKLAAEYSAVSLDPALGEPVELAAMPLPRSPKPRLPNADRFHLNDFLALHDANFVDAAYRGILVRDADPQGRDHFLASLRAGSLGKIEILGRLRYSPEGRRHGVVVRGLLPAFAAQAACRVPVLGGFVAFALALLRLPRFARTLQGFENYQHYRNAESESAIAGLAQTVEGNERLLADEIAWRAAQSSERLQQFESLFARWQASEADRGRREAQLAQRAANAESQLRLLAERLASGETWRVRADERLEAHESRIAVVESHKPSLDRRLIEAMELAQTTSARLASTVQDTFASLDKRIETLGGAWRNEQNGSRAAHLRLIERLARVEGRVHEQALRAADEMPPPRSALPPQDRAAPAEGVASARFDKLYFAFEQRFRGSREDIRQRLSYYLPLLRDSAVGEEGAAVLDIGCGRGEWLELLRDERIAARGVDIDEAMVAECAGRGLAAEAGDAIAYLKRLPDNALGALTGFHIIEHVTLETLLELIDEAHRVVQPGGLVIFETPNPENVVVGACNFYIDPTHRRPLPPVLTQFLVESGGFVDVAIHRVNADLLPKLFDEPAAGDPPALRSALAWLRSVFSCAPDYSVVGRVA
ncbi:MAG: methionine biosynthesis protein MetW [Rudaea sp.]|uniref:methyltransferase domain-containing protein n=1 Tax=Rudaea sp. TaxID=2136325 RepID=UPI0039E24111